MLVEFIQENDHLLISIMDDIMMDNSREFYIEFERIFVDERVSVKTLSLNFGEVRFMDSSGIGAIIKCTNKVKEEGINIIVFNLNKTLYSVFRLSGLQNILETLELDTFRERFPEFKPYLSKYND
ncbi:MAG: STAS domain-containing protein [Leptospiraceae bacterium]|jgi:stage II sporulation protein AA (anti-sigma F factor antagonist)|nr:STAS domain-containing protein [Leptospiraceae bacterium]MCZ8346344.1 STAS domain-containing protein [Leptospiraceae bacterium]PJE00321.1 MAG: anti-anti-sigma factor [Leptospira sp.]